MVVPAVRTTVARWLEQGFFSGPGARAIARAHGAFASRAVARPLDVPFRDPRIVTITVGGATLGGSGKTRVALACVRDLVSRGANVVLVGHAYRAMPLRARVVTADDTLADVGDEALACARALARVSSSARVVVGPTRQAAIDFAATLSPAVDAVVIDGPLQLAPVRSSLSILALDAVAPWGAGAVPPAGDLRAPREALLAHADHVVAVDPSPPGLASLAASLEGSGIGLFSAIARPVRLERALARAGIRLRVVVRAGDHGPMTSRLERRIQAADVDNWLATEKCALHLEGLDPACRVAILDGSTMLPAAIAASVGATLTSVA